MRLVHNLQDHHSIPTNPKSDTAFIDHGTFINCSVQSDGIRVQLPQNTFASSYKSQTPPLPNPFSLLVSMHLQCHL